MSDTEATIHELKDRIQANRQLLRIGVKGLELRAKETAMDALSSPVTPGVIFAGCLGLGLFLGRRRKKPRVEKRQVQQRPTIVDEFGKLLAIIRKNIVWIGPLVKSWQNKREETEQVQAAANADHLETETAA